MSKDTSIKIDHKRVIVIVGVPFPPVKDPAIKFKKDYNNQKRVSTRTGLVKQKIFSYSRLLTFKKLVDWFWFNFVFVFFPQSGFDFMEREAYKAINLITNHQINLSSEYGVILLFDERFRDEQLSLWLKDRIKSEKRFTEMLQELNDFFNGIEKRTKWIMVSKTGLLYASLYRTCFRQITRVILIAGNL